MLVYLHYIGLYILYYITLYRMLYRSGGIESLISPKRLLIDKTDHRPTVRPFMDLIIVENTYLCTYPINPKSTGFLSCSGLINIQRRQMR